MKSLSVSKAINFGWDKFNEHFGTAVGFTISYCLVWLAVGIIGPMLEDIFSSFLGDVILVILGLVVGALALTMQLGLNRFGLRFCDNEKPRVTDLFKEWPHIINFLLAGLPVAIIYLPGAVVQNFLGSLPISEGTAFILLMIYYFLAGIIGLRVQFFPYLIIDKGVSPIRSIKASFQLTSGVTPTLILLALVHIFINCVGALLLVIGLFISIPVTFISLAYVYRSLLSQTDLSV